MRKVVVIVLLLLAVFTFINAYSTEQMPAETTVSAKTGTIAN